MRKRSPHTTGRRPGRGRGRPGCRLTRCPANSAAPSSSALRGRGNGVGEAFLGLHQRAWIFLRAMVSDPGVCPSLAKDGAPRCALKSFCRRIPVSAPLAGVGLLIAFLSTFGCLVRAPGTAVYYLSMLFLANSLELASNFSNSARFCYEEGGKFL